MKGEKENATMDSFALLQQTANQIKQPERISYVKKDRQERSQSVEANEFTEKSISSYVKSNP